MAAVIDGRAPVMFDAVGFFRWMWETVWHAYVALTARDGAKVLLSQLPAWMPMASHAVHLWPGVKAPVSQAGEMA